MRAAYWTSSVLVLTALAGCATHRSQEAQTTPAAKPETAAQFRAKHYSGTPAPGSKFARLKMGMSMQQVEHQIGPPTSQSTHMTGKQFIPFYFGGDTYRTDFYYRREGELTFSPDHMGDSNQTLIYMRVNPKATGYP